MVLNQSSLSMSVNIRLCGGIPRSDMQREGAPWDQLAKAGVHLNTKALQDTIRSKNDGATPAMPLSESFSPSHIPNVEENNTMGVLTERQPFTPLFEPPSWAVPAVGHTRLEPICGTDSRHSSIDLTMKAAFRVGRAPACDVQLLHPTSSRRHAMVFHHKNGSCYIVDCGSAHGTFVNGRRITSCSRGGMVVPHKVRRGAIVRFGGDGAPSFMLKSFRFELKSVIEDSIKIPDSGELVRRNTRINALGGVASSHINRTIIMAKAFRKRSFESLASAATLDEDEPSCKRLRCSSPPLSPEESPLRLISPELSITKTRRVHFNDKPQCFYPASVTPEDLSDADC